jgi:addiction module HigA family antidote
VPEPNTSRFGGDYALSPGETLLELLQEKSMSQSDLARLMGRPAKTINEIVQGKAAVTPDTALQLERVLGLKASAWNHLEADYQEDRHRLEEEQRLAADTDWLKRFPLAEMRRHLLISSEGANATAVEELLRFFGVGSKAGWEKQWTHVSALARLSPSFKSKKEPLYAWLRWGEIVASRIKPPSTFDAARFRKVLMEARSLTLLAPRQFIPRVQKLFASAGVVIVFLPEFTGIKVSGVARWILGQIPLVQVSWRHKTDDQVWFSVYHESGHLILHRNKEVFLDDSPWPQEISSLETEANRFAGDMLIPPTEYRKFLDGGDLSISAVGDFADAVGIAPGVVLGRLQHEGRVAWSAGHRLKQTMRWQLADTPSVK